MATLKISDLEFAKKLTPTFRDHLERFLPQWLDSLVPYYEEAKAIGADMFKLQDTMPCGGEYSLFEKDGIGYYLTDFPWLKCLSFNSDYKYIKCYWYQCFVDFYPRLDTDWKERIHNFGAYNWYMYRPFNMKEGYDCVAKRVDDYFKAITNDPDVTFMLSGTSVICLTPKGVRWIEDYCKLE